MKRIPLSKGLEAIIDDEDYDLVAAHSWHAQKSGNIWYAARNFQEDDGSRWTLMLHRAIMQPPEDMEVDHINRNALDCRRCNMRLATRGQNVINVIMPQGENGSGYRGVFKKPNGRWQAQLYRGGKCHWLGLHDTPEEAAHAYDKAARELHGEFAVLNFPEED